MKSEKINVDQENVLQNINSFYYFGMNWNDNYEKITIIEEAINTTHEKLIQAIKDRATHTHKRNMIYTYQKLVELYRIAFIHTGSDYYNKCLAKKCLSRFEQNKELIETISKIINHEDFTHFNHEILLRPYLYDFENNCSIHHYDQYKRVRERLEEKLNKIVIKLLNKATLSFDGTTYISHIREEVFTIIKEKYQACQECYIFYLKDEIENKLCPGCNQVRKNSEIKESIKEEN